MDHIYRKKPIVIEAFQVTMERYENNFFLLSDWPDWLKFEGRTGNLEEGLVIKTLKGYMKVSWGDYIIRGVEGKLYSCKPDIFEKTYEKVILAYLD